MSTGVSWPTGCKRSTRGCALLYDSVYEEEFLFILSVTDIMELGTGRLRGRIRPHLHIRGQKRLSVYINK